VKHKPNKIPRLRAMGGERSPVNERTSARKKRISASKDIDGKKSNRAGAGAGNCDSSE
jgi:hypothetical protein